MLQSNTPVVFYTTLSIIHLQQSHTCATPTQLHCATAEHHVLHTGTTAPPLPPTARTAAGGFAGLACTARAPRVARGILSHATNRTRNTVLRRLTSPAPAPARDLAAARVDDSAPTHDGLGEELIVVIVVIAVIVAIVVIIVVAKFAWGLCNRARGQI